MTVNQFADTWPPNTLTRSKMLAYKALDDDGQITISKVQVSASTGAHKVLYSSLLDKPTLNAQFKKILAQKGADAP